MRCLNNLDCRLDRSLEAWRSVGVDSKGAVDNSGSFVVEEGNNWLALRAVPGHVSWSSQSVSVACFVVQMVDWSLVASPLQVHIWHWGDFREFSAETPPEEVWIIQQLSRAEGVAVEHNWFLLSESSSDTFTNEEDHVDISNPASSVETLNWEFSNHSESEDESKSCSVAVACIVPVRTGGWSVNQIFRLLDPRA